MRVVAGSARGRRLAAPEGVATRPTTDRVRESLSNALESLEAIEDAVVLDLFAGSGALGIEMLSRGAEHAVFVESDRAAVKVIEQNLAATGMGDRATVVPRDAFVALASDYRDYDLVLLDPPYTYTAWDTLLAAVEERLAADALVVVESNVPVTLPDGWGWLREKRYGDTLVSFAHRTVGHPSYPGANS